MLKRTWLTVLVLVAVLALAFGVTSVFAHGATESNGDWWATESYCPGMAGGWGTGGFHYIGLTDPVTLERVAGTLGLTYEQLTTRLTQGETIAQVAQAQGADSSLVVTTILAPQTEILQVRVKYGYLSQEQAQAILEQARLWVEQAIATPWYGYYAPSDGPTTGYEPGAWGGPGGMMGPGMMGGWSTYNPGAELQPYPYGPGGGMMGPSMMGGMMGTVGGGS